MWKCWEIVHSWGLCRYGSPDHRCWVFFIPLWGWGNVFENYMMMGCMNISENKMTNNGRRLHCGDGPLGRNLINFISTSHLNMTINTPVRITTSGWISRQPSWFPSWISDQTIKLILIFLSQQSFTASFIKIDKAVTEEMSCEEIVDICMDGWMNRCKETDYR